MIQDVREQIEIGNYGRALNRIDDLLWKEPENAELRGLRGVVLVAQELNLEGIEDLGTSIALADAAEFRYWRSVALFEEKEFDRSIEDAEKAVQLESENYLYLHHLIALYQNLGPVDKSMGIIDRVLAIEPGDIQSLMARAYVFIKWQEFDLAIEDYEEIIKQDYYEEDIFNNLGYCHDRKQEYDKAQLYYEKALEINPYHQYALNNLGLIYCGRGGFREGEKMILKSIGYDPQNSYAYKNMGKAKLLQGLKEEALQYFLKSKELGYSEAYDAEVDDILVEDFNL